MPKQKKIRKKGRAQLSMFNTQLLNWLDLAISNLSEGTCWLLKNISKRPTLISTNVSSWSALLTKVPLAGLQLRNMGLTSLPKILNTRRNFKWLSLVHMSKLNRSLPNLMFQGFQMLPNPKIFKVHKSLDLLDLLLLLHLYIFCSL